MEIKYIKSAVRLLNRNCVNEGGLDLSKEVLWVSVQGVKKRMDTYIFRSSHYVFAPIASIYQNELFIMNLSLKGGTVGVYNSITTEDTHQNVF